MSPEQFPARNIDQMNVNTGNAEFSDAEDSTNVISIAEWKEQKAREQVKEAFSPVEALSDPDAEVAHKGLQSLIETSRKSQPEQAYENSKLVIEARKAYQANTFDLKNDSIEGVQAIAFNRDISRPNAA